MEVTPQAIQNAQGTRLSEKAPWETYAEEMGSKLDPQLAEAVKRYEERAHHKVSQEAEEELARQKELSDALAKNYQWVKPEEYEYVAPRIGHIIHSSVFINDLREKCKLKCWYSGHMLPRRITLTIQLPGREPEFGCWLMEGFMPEYSIMRFDEHHAPLDERLRGWRTVLLQLILKGAITEEKANEVFGAAYGPASERYNSLLFEVRNHLVIEREE